MHEKKFVILVTGQPGCGKTTLLESLMREWRGRIKIAGFITREIRANGQRVGFELISTDGQRRLLSHINLNTPFRVGKYRVDIRGFEEFLSHLSLTGPGQELIILDEIGKMECLSEYFRQLVLNLIEKGPSLLATVALAGTPYIEQIKSRPGAELILLTAENRNQVRDYLKARLSHFLLKS
ncbi:MAG: AAA family ATPase [Candidatus Aminicenantes bacterium]|nr:AAA family ATPase [Candidatus Aminicenantes bacterium]